MTADDFAAQVRELVDHVVADTAWACNTGQNRTRGADDAVLKDIEDRAISALLALHEAALRQVVATARIEAIDLYIRSCNTLSNGKPSMGSLMAFQDGQREAFTELRSERQADTA